MNFKLQNFKLLKYKAADSFCNLKSFIIQSKKKRQSELTFQTQQAIYVQIC